MRSFKLWEDDENNGATIDCYFPFIKASDVAVVIFPGGAYFSLAEHEGEGYARLLNTFGITAFVVNYRLYPNVYFPAQLEDARRAMRFVRAKSEEFGIAKNKVLAMGSSAGGHLTALLSTYVKQLDEGKDVMGKEDYLPNGQILCYPVISSDETISHRGSFERLLGKEYASCKEEISPELLVNEKTPPAFIWHTAEDEGVSVMNSYRYAQALQNYKVPYELHIFPFGLHGRGIAPDIPSVGQWTDLLRSWIKENF